MNIAVNEPGGGPAAGLFAGCGGTGTGCAAAAGGEALGEAAKNAVKLSPGLFGCSLLGCSLLGCSEAAAKLLLAGGPNACGDGFTAGPPKSLVNETGSPLLAAAAGVGGACEAG